MKTTGCLRWNHELYNLAVKSVREGKSEMEHNGILWSVMDIIVDLVKDISEGKLEVVDKKNGVIGGTYMIG